MAKLTKKQQAAIDAEREARFTEFEALKAKFEGKTISGLFA